jgi:hypothetical protein
MSAKKCFVYSDMYMLTSCLSLSLCAVFSLCYRSSTLLFISSQDGCLCDCFCERLINVGASVHYAECGWVEPKRLIFVADH